MADRDRCQGKSHVGKTQELSGEILYALFLKNPVQVILKSLSASKIPGVSSNSQSLEVLHIKCLR